MKTYENLLVYFFIHQGAWLVKSLNVSQSKNKTQIWSVTSKGKGTYNI
jgi:hypothetical protein